MDPPDAPRSAHPVLLYDGHCGFCDWTVRLVLRIDRHARFRFAPLQGELAAGVRDRHPELEAVDSLVLVEALDGGTRPGGAAQVDQDTERVSVRSDALLRTVRLLGGAWTPLLVLGVLPRPLRDWAYDTFARHRYRLFGRHEACPVPPREVRSRFLA